MSDRRAVSAGHLGASSVATANETWRVAVGGNRVENMTVDQIAHAFQSGHLNVRTPLWPPGTTGWQALGNFEQFQMNQAAYGGNQGGLAQFEEADDDPTRMWTGGNEYDLPGMEGMGAPQPPAQQRPMARTGVRQVAQPSRPVPMPSRPAPVASARPAPTASLPPSRSASVAPASIPPFRQSRGNGLMLVAGLVGLVGLGSAVLAARGNWGQSEPAQAAATKADAPSAEAAPKAEAPVPVIAADPAPAKAEAVGEARLAKYEDTSASAFVAGEQKPAATAEAKAVADEPAKADEAKAEEAKADEASAEESNAEAKAEEAKSRADSRSEKASKASKAKAEKAEKAAKVAARATAKRAAAASIARSKPEPTVEKAEKIEKAEKPEKVEKVEKAEKAAEAPQAPANGAVNEAAAAALASSANLASSCRPRGGPAGAGKARIIYSNDGEVQSVEILTAKFRDTLTGSCVRMVFRRAKIPAFKGEPPTFIKSFTIPEE